MNLLQETVEILANNGKTDADVKWIGSRDGRYALDWSKFAITANIDYDNGYGGQEIALDLVVVGDGWWLERREYDGSESWAFKEAPMRNLDSNPFETVRNGDSWATVQEMNRPGGMFGED